MSRLAYHTFYGSFSGDTAADIVQHVYKDSRRRLGSEWPRQEWWDYQRRLWKLLEGANLPDTPDEPDAAEAFITCVVEAGALDEGPKPE
jgi:hypothetical protein